MLGVALLFREVVDVVGEGVGVGMCGVTSVMQEDVGQCVTGRM